MTMCTVKTCDDCNRELTEEFMQVLTTIPENIGVLSHDAAVRAGLDPVFPAGHDYHDRFYYAEEGIFDRVADNALNPQQERAILCQQKREVA